MSRYFSVTFTHKYENACEYTPRTAVFSSREKAEKFKRDVMAMHDERDQDYLIATIDSGTVDSDSYFDIFDAEMTEDGECLCEDWDNRAWE